MQHAKTRTTTPTSASTNEIVYESFTTKLNIRKVETEQSIFTSRATFLADIMKCLDIISSKESKELTIRIETNEYFEPQRIVKTWTVSKEHYGK